MIGTQYNMLMKEADQLTEEKAYAQAEVFYKNILLRYPNDIDLLSMLGSLYFDEERVEKALEIFKHILTIDAEDAFAHTMSAICYMTLAEEREDTDYEEQAIVHYERALALDPSYGDNSLYYDLALAYMYTNNYDKAIDNFEKCLETSNGVDVTVYDYIGALYAEQGKPDTAERFRLHALSLEESSVRYYSLGQTYTLMKKYDKAVEAYRKATELDPEYEEAFCNLSDTYLHLQQFDKALEAGLKAVSLNPDDPIALTNVAESYEGLGDGSLARVYYDKAVEIGPMHEAVRER